MRASVYPSHEKPRECVRDPFHVSLRRKVDGCMYAGSSAGSKLHVQRVTLVDANSIEHILRSRDWLSEVNPCFGLFPAKPSPQIRGARRMYEFPGSRITLAWDRAALWSAGSRHFPCENKRARFPSSGSLRKRRSPFSKGRTRAHPTPNQATKCRPRTLQMRHATRYACSQSTRLIQRALISEIFNSFESNHSSSRVLRQLNRRP